MLTLSLPGSAVDGPVVIAVLVDVALSVEEESIFAVLEAERAVGALEEVVAQLRVGVGLHAMLFGAVRSGSSKHYGEETKKYHFQILLNRFSP
jgi:hypothetical protein